MKRTLINYLGLLGMQVEKAEAMDIYFDNAASIALGIMFILGSLLCRYGAELKERAEK